MNLRDNQKSAPHGTMLILADYLKSVAGTLIRA